MAVARRLLAARVSEVYAIFQTDYPLYYNAMTLAGAYQGGADPFLEQLQRQKSSGSRRSKGRGGDSDTASVHSFRSQDTGF